MGMRQASAARLQLTNCFSALQVVPLKILTFQTSTVWSRTLSEDYRRTRILGLTGTGNMLQGASPETVSVASPPHCAAHPSGVFRALNLGFLPAHTMTGSTTLKPTAPSGRENSPEKAFGRVPIVPAVLDHQPLKRATLCRRVSGPLRVLQLEVALPSSLLRKALKHL